MRAVLLALAACAPAKWPVPAGWRSEVIPFPIDFAPTLAHRGVEELRFPPGFFDPASPARWSYAFVWRLEDPAELAPDALAAELTVYFQGLVHAVDPSGTEPITVQVAPDMSIRVHLEDAFKTHAPIDLTGTAERRACGKGALWVIVLAPETTGIRAQLVELARAAACDQATAPPPAHK
jgi:hypothetical protein